MCSSQNGLFLDTMSVCKRSLFSVWRSENDFRKRFSALENYIYSNANEKPKCIEEEHDLIAESFQHNLQLTMIDGKVFSVVAECSSQACGICKATPKMINDLDLVASLPKCEDLYEFGISTLHAWIRCFECMLHVGYRLPIKKWQVCGLDKNIVNKRKEEIQERFRIEMALLVDIPMQGSGNTNNINCLLK